MEKLDVLIINTAQTLTDLLELEKEAIQWEEQLRRAQGGGYTVMDAGYTPRVLTYVQFWRSSAPSRRLASFAKWD